MIESGSRLGPTRKIVVLLLALPLSLLAAGCGGGDDEVGVGALQITATIDFSTRPFSGTFEVTEGSDSLGCRSGTFVDPTLSGDIRKTFTCEEGNRSGTFTALIVRPAEEGEVTSWEIVGATQDFAGLQGGGDFSVDENAEERSGLETLTGDVNY